MDVFDRFCDLLGACLTAKSEAGPPIDSIGLLGPFPAPENEFNFLAIPPGEKKKAWSPLIPPTLRMTGPPIGIWGSLSAGCRSRKRSFFPKFARAQIPPTLQ